MTLPRPDGEFIREDLPTPLSPAVTEKQGDKTKTKKKADENKADEKAEPKKLNEG